MKMTALPRWLDSDQDHQDIQIIRDYLAGLGASRIWVFGAAAHNELIPTSDFDVLTEGLLPETHSAAPLRRLIRRHAHIVARKFGTPDIPLQGVPAEAIRIYDSASPGDPCPRWLDSESTHSTITAVRDYFASIGAKSIWVFGSAARNEMRADSDIDVIVQFRNHPTPRTCLSMLRSMKRLTWRWVDVVFMSPRGFRLMLLESALLIYDKDQDERETMA